VKTAIGKSSISSTYENSRRYIRKERKVPYVPTHGPHNGYGIRITRPNVCAKKDVYKTEETVEEEEVKFNTT
jgi:hypothetical protein